MKSKIVSLFLLTVTLALVLTSAATFNMVSSTTNDFSKLNSQTSLNIKNNGPENISLTIVLPVQITDGTRNITITSSSPLTYTNLAANQNIPSVVISYTGDTTNFGIGSFSSNIVINANQVGNSSNSLTQTVPLRFVNTFCKYGENSSDLEITSVDINNADGDNTEWKPLDEVTVKVKVENTADDKITSIYAEIGLYDSKGKNIISDVDNLADKKVSLGTINDGSSKTAEFKFNVPTDFKDEEYRLVVKAYKSGKEASICTSTSSDLGSNHYETITGIRETEYNKQVIIGNIELSPEGNAQCGDKVQLTGDVVNIGDTDYPDQTKVTLYSKELGINKEQLIREDLDQGDSATIDFEFDVPINATEKAYVLELRTFYDYDSDDNTYAETSNEKFTKSITIQGNCQKVSTNSVQISAQLDPQTPEATAGKQVIIKTTLKNTGTDSTTYALSIYGNSAWSSLVSIDPQTVTLNAGESRDVSIVLTIDSQAQGDNEFTIKTTYGSQTTEKRVVLSVTKSGVQFNSLTNHLKNNWFIYLIVLVNVVLIIAIIIVIRRMVKPRKRQYE